VPPAAGIELRNNVAEVHITIPDHPGRQGVGPLKDEAANVAGDK